MYTNNNLFLHQSYLDTEVNFVSADIQGQGIVERVSCEQRTKVNERI